MTPVVHCRLCLARVQVKLSLTPTPIANSFPETAEKFAIKYPLDLTECPNCGHVQLGFHIPGETLFQDYKYRTPEIEKERLGKYAQKLAETYPQWLGTERPRVLEIGSNNGFFIDALRAAGFFAVGIDPCGPQNGMPRWFNSKSAKNLVFSLGKVKMILANNVFAHVDDLRNIFVGIDRILDDDGVVIFEVQYFKKLVDGGMFDMIYHEHRDYHTLKPFLKFLPKFGMKMDKFEFLETHGGSIRVYVKRGVQEPIDLPDETIDWEGFWTRIQSEKMKVRDAVNGHKVAAFGATAKATTLIHQFDLAERISYCVDETPTKQGRYIPGTAIQIVGPEVLKAEPPDALLVTAWNYADHIKRRFSLPMIVPFS